MGIETAALVLGGIAMASEAGGMVMKVNAANETEKALDLQAKENRLQYQQKTLSNYEMIEKTLDAQTAQQTVRGTAFNSPSFNAIQRDTVNIGSRKQKNLDIEEDLNQRNISIEKQNVRSKLYASLFGDVSNIARSAMSFNDSIPRTG